MVSDPNGKRDRWLKPVEAKRLLKEAKTSKASHLHDFILLALNTGARSGELMNLEWSRVDLTANEIYLEAIHTKSARPRVLPLNQEARQALIGRMKFRAEQSPDAPYVFVNRRGQSRNLSALLVTVQEFLISESMTCVTRLQVGW